MEVQRGPRVCGGGAVHDLLRGGEPIRSVSAQDAVQDMLAGFPQHLPIQVVQVKIKEHLPALPVPMVGSVTVDFMPRRAV